MARSGFMRGCRSCRMSAGCCAHATGGAFLRWRWCCRSPVRYPSSLSAACRSAPGAGSRWSSRRRACSAQRRFSDLPVACGQHDRAACTPGVYCPRMYPASFNCTTYMYAEMYLSLLCNGSVSDVCCSAPDYSVQPCRADDHQWICPTPCAKRRQPLVWRLAVCIVRCSYRRRLVTERLTSLNSLEHILSVKCAT